MTTAGGGGSAGAPVPTRQARWRHARRGRFTLGGGDVGTGIAGCFFARRPAHDLAIRHRHGQPRCALRLTALLDRQTLHEDPADERHGLAADQAAFVEQPRVVAVELLE